MMEFVIGGEDDETSLAGTEREEQLGGGCAPNLQRKDHQKPLECPLMCPVAFLLCLYILDLCESQQVHEKLQSVIVTFYIKRKGKKRCCACLAMKGRTVRVSIGYRPTIYVI